MIKPSLLILVFILCVLIPQNGSASKGVSARKQNVYSFAFRTGAELYEEGYMNNASEWQRLITHVSQLSDLQTDSYYVLIESFLGEGEDTDEYLLNRAAFRGSLIRSLLKQRLNIPYEQVAFYINRNGKMADVVRVSLVKQAMPEQINRDIFFSFSSASTEISRTLARYEQLPFYDLDYYETEETAELPNRVEQPQPESFVAEEIVEIKPADNSLLSLPDSSCKEEKDIKKEKEVPVLLAETKKQGADLFNLGIKTNLLPWLGLVPAWSLSGNQGSDFATGPIMYNGAVEYSFARRYSVEFSFLYAYSSYDGRKDNLWGVSQFTLEPRLWLSDNNRFHGFNVGFRVGYGDFDIRDNKPQNHGQTGRFYSAGFTMGYTLPLYSSWLLLEGRLLIAYRNVYDGKEYRYSPEENKNYYEDAFSQGNWLVGASVNLLFRCGFHK